MGVPRPIAAQKPWPVEPGRDLAVYEPEQWKAKMFWHFARAAVARDLNRPLLPEISGASLLENHRVNPEYRAPEPEDAA